MEKQPMTQPQPSRLIVENVHRFSRRPWIFVTGRLEGGEIAIGDSVSIAYGGRMPVTTTVRSIELHGPPGKTTIALDATLESAVGTDAVITRG
ncbi:hypothetical protein Asp14428_76040 [Actinoplanes sp. NBRC 14428]|nr:hypothetical protein Asp14428_76040 [Actinoplanes sp. NBRC 14428]